MRKSLKYHWEKLECKEILICILKTYKHDENSWKSMYMG